MPRRRVPETVLFQEQVAAFLCAGRAAGALGSFGWGSSLTREDANQIVAQRPHIPTASLGG